jgi:hypothetical protein
MEEAGAAGDSPRPQAASEMTQRLMNALRFRKDLFVMAIPV